MEHTNHMGKVVPERQQGTLTCKCQCEGKLSDLEKIKILSDFNALKSHEKQNLYLRGLVQRRDEEEIRRRKKKGELRAERNSYRYTISLNQCDISVCKFAFCALHGIKECRLKRKVLNFQAETLLDLRGKHGQHPKLDVSVRQKIREHISSFPARESHYSRSVNRERKYLDSHLSVSELFKMCQKLHPEMDDKTEWVYRDIFNHEFNISFGFPRTDLCDACELFIAKIRAAKACGDDDETLKLEREHDIHKRKGDAFYNQIKELSEIAKNRDDMVVISMDFQKNHVLPKTGTGQEYYKRQLAIHNFEIHDCVTKNANMFIYPENFAGKGPNEVISCIDHFIQTLPDTIQHLVLFTDNCFSQNKNRYISAYFQELANSRFLEVNIFYPLPGHSFMPCDRDFARIEKKTKKRHRFILPSEITSLIKSASQRSEWTINYVQCPFTDDLKEDGSIVVKVKDFKKALDPLIKAPDGIASARGICFQRTKVPLMRDSMTGPFTRDLQLLKRGRNVRSLIAALEKDIEYVDEGFVPIKKAKYDDIFALLRHAFLSDNVTFYSSLTHASANTNDADGNDAVEYE